MSIEAENSVNDCWRKLEENVDVAEEAICTMNVLLDKNECTMKHTPCFCDKVKHLAQMRRSGCLIYHRRNTRQFCSKYKLIRNSVNSGIRKIKQD